LDEFKGQHQRSEVNVTRDKNVLSLSTPLAVVRMVCAPCKQHAAAADNTIWSLPGGDFGGLRAVYVLENIFSCSLINIYFKLFYNCF